MASTPRRSALARAWSTTSSYARLSDQSLVATTTASRSTEDARIPSLTTASLSYTSAVSTCRYPWSSAYATVSGLAWDSSLS